jgi:hypothetical protein
MRYFAALYGEPPVPQLLDAELAHWGGVRGDWGDEVSCANLRATRLPPDVLGDVLEVLPEKRRSKVRCVVAIDGNDFDAAEVLGTVLIEACAGALIDDEGEQVAFCGKPKRSLDDRSEDAGLVVDLAVPEEVGHSFGSLQSPLKLAARQDTVDITFGRLLRQYGSQPTHVVYPDYTGWDDAMLGDLVVNERKLGDLSHYAADLARLGIAGCPVVYTVKFRHWHITRVPQPDWDTMLALLCGLGRATHGVLYRDEPFVSYDFAPRPA